jgi:hypothetical protein
VFTQHQLTRMLHYTNGDINVIDLLTITHRFTLIQTRWRVIAVFLKESPCYTFSFKDLVIRTFLTIGVLKPTSMPIYLTLLAVC